VHHFAFPAVALGLMSHAIGQSPPTHAPFVPGSVAVDGHDYPYLLLEPLPHLRSGELPLVVFLHGAGERGSDNDAQRKWLPEVLAEPALRERLPCYVLAVQCPAESRWVEVSWSDATGNAFPVDPSPAMRAVQVAVEDLLARLPIDRARVYLTGLSMGGQGCWDLASRQPDRFAAMLAVCGGGDRTRANDLIGLPICVYHGDADRTVPVARSRLMVAALRSLGVPVLYHELPGVGHDSWQKAYGPEGALDWLFQQDQRQQGRGAWQLAPLVPAADRVECTAGRFLLGPTARCCASGAVRDAATVLLDAMSVQGRTLPLVSAEPRPGDLVLAIDAAQADAVVITVGDTVSVQTRDAEGMQRAVGFAWQLLGSEPAMGVAKGTYAMRTMARGGQIALAAVGVQWSASLLRQLLITAWCHGVVRIQGEGLEGLAWLGEAEQVAVRGLASRAGITFSDTSAAPAPSCLDLGDANGRFVDLLTILRQPWPEGVAEDQVWVRVPQAFPAETLAALRTRLPAAVERAHAAGRPLHVGGFLSRLGAQLRTPL
jgi:predicted esterase